MFVLIVSGAMILAALAVLLFLLAGLSRRVLALTDRLTITKDRAAALDQALAHLPGERP